MQRFNSLGEPVTNYEYILDQYKTGQYENEEDKIDLVQGIINWHIKKVYKTQDSAYIESCILNDVSNVKYLEDRLKLEQEWVDAAQRRREIANGTYKKYKPSLRMIIAEKIFIALNLAFHLFCIYHIFAFLYRNFLIYIK